MKRIIDIDGWYFVVNKPLDKFPIVATHKIIYDCYKRPSSRKVAIWHNICEFFATYSPDYDCHCGIKSYNNNIFTVNGIIAYENKMYYVEIYPTHNELYPIEVSEV